MSQTTNPLPREVADAYVDELIALDPVTGTYLGVKESSSRLPDLSPGGRRRSHSWRGGPWSGSTRPSGSPARTVTSSAAAAVCCASG